MPLLGRDLLTINQCCIHTHSVALEKYTIPEWTAVMKFQQVLDHVRKLDPDPSMFDTVRQAVLATTTTTTAALSHASLTLPRKWLQQGRRVTYECRNCRHSRCAAKAVASSCLAGRAVALLHQQRHQLARRGR